MSQFPHHRSEAERGDPQTASGPLPLTGGAGARTRTTLRGRKRGGWSAVLRGGLALLPLLPTPSSAQTKSDRPAVWTQEGTLPDTGFGGWVASAGDVNHDGFADVLIAAPYFDQNRGQVFLYLGSPTGLATEPSWTAVGESRGDWFGNFAIGVGDVNGDGWDDVAVSAHLYSEEGAGVTQFGSVYLYLGSPGGLTPQPQQIFRGNVLYEQFGSYVGAAGDVNGDGFADVMITSTQFRKGGVVVGRTALFLGSPQGLNPEPIWIQEGDQPSGNFGQTAIGAGDVNGDGYGDVILGMPHWDFQFMDEGKAILYLGSAQGLAATPAWTAVYDANQPRWEGGAYLQLFANNVAPAGDVNGDGFADVLVTAYFAEQTDRDEGMVFLYLGSPTGLSPDPAWVARGHQSSALFGTSGGGAGDLNGDGFADIIIGARQGSHGELLEGGVFVFYGSPRGLGPDPDWTFECNQPSAHLGGFVARAGDVNGDGYDDVLMAATEYQRDGQRVGKVWLFYGGPRGLEGSTGWPLRKPWTDAVGQRLSTFLQRHGGWVMAGGGLALALAGGGWWRVRRKHSATRQLADQRQRQLLDERTRVAREIHDNLGADLHHLALLSQAALDDTDRAGQRQERLVRLSERAQELVGSIKELSWLTHPRHDSLAHLADYLGDYATDYFEPSPVRCELELPTTLPSLGVPADIRHHLLLILKEACHNVLRHAEASRVRLTLEFADSRLRLSVADNGRGFDLSDVKSQGNGLLNLRRRVEEMKGRYEVRTQPGRGTEIWVEVHLDPKKEPSHPA